MNQKQKDHDEAMKTLKALRLRPNETVYTQLEHVSKSGMTRTINVYIMRKNEPRRISWQVAKLLDYPQDRDTCGVKVSGCGMDMGFSLVYNLGAIYWPNGTKKPHGTRNGEPDSDGGYALKQKWL